MSTTPRRIQNCRCVSLLSLILLGCLQGPSFGGIVNIHDETFSRGSWTVGILGGTNVVRASIATEIGTGVTGNTQITSISGTGAYTFDVQHFKVDQSFSPSRQGVIDSIGWEVWHKTRNESEFAGFRLAARQGGSTFIAQTTYFEPELYQSFWQRGRGFIPATDFVRATGSGTPHLSFLADSPDIQFGYVLSRGVFRAGSTSYRASFYSLDLHVSPLQAVPEPSSFILATVSLLTLLVYQRITSSKSPRSHDEVDPLSNQYQGGGSLLIEIIGERSTKHSTGESVS